MMKIIIALSFLFAWRNAAGQYVHYSDESKKNSPSPAKPANDSIVYHVWPDKCPGLTGSIPVLSSYVPHEMVLKLTEIYKGHLYSISPVKLANGKVQYKMKVCVKGEITFTYADENGHIISP